MEDESKYRVEEAEEEEKEKKGLFRPLPKVEEETVIGKSGRPEPIVKFFGLKMTERRRDLLLILLMPAMAGLVDAAVYSFIIIGTVDSVGLYTFVIPMLAAIPVGLVVSRASHALLSALLATLFYVLFFLLFLASPAIQWPAFDLGQFLVSGFVIAAVYLLLVILASLLGALIGAIIREFF